MNGVYLDITPNSWTANKEIYGGKQENFHSKLMMSEKINRIISFPHADIKSPYLYVMQKKWCYF